mmetsp:Transcript_18023/g.13052  ORF Transcript_18023/g.13052 Transcript_18023/m.13052 type:complete len:266 (-) Transcript_18023:309-1106(-)
MKEIMEQEIGALVNTEVKMNILNTQQFEHSIEDGLAKVFMYEDELVQSIALSLIPEDIPRINSEAEKLKALMHWFKQEFFTWCDRPNCPKCYSNNHVKQSGTGYATAEEREGHAARVELYRCMNCNVEVRFPRYNHPMKLFETRTGRCGEWANAFTAMCVALGFKARFVHDWTDHVWTECYLEDPHFQRWVHLDPCEAAFDSPLLYEKGWGKKLTYVVAISNEEVVDVSRRYVLNPQLNKMRKTLVPEQWLATFLAQKRTYLWEV